MIFHGSLADAKIGSDNLAWFAIKNQFHDLAFSTS
jgi:hypothetical protein